MVTNKSQSDSSFCVIINIFENKGLFMMHKKIRNKDYYIFIFTEICCGGYTYAEIIDRNMRGGGILMLTLCKHCAFLKKEKISVLYIIL